MKIDRLAWEATPVTIASRPKTGGRKKGTPNRATADLREAAGAYTSAALGVLVEVATKGASEAARVAAANSILDRAHGRPAQAVEMTGKDGGPIETKVRDDRHTAKAVLALFARLKADQSATGGGHA